ncbi:MAG: SDR family oxidoreductase [Myxococcota bacterium]
MARTLVVGANRGIGFHLTKQLREVREHSVIATCRRRSTELDSLDVEVIDGVDVTRDDSVAALDKSLGDRKLSGMLVVAGVLKRTSLDNLDWDAIRLQLEVNALGPLRVIAALQARVVDGGRIGILTSRMGSLADNTSGGSYGYRMSKCAVNAAGVSLARDLASREIAVGLLHPGFVRTEMTGGNGNLDPDESARMLLDRYEDLTMETTGRFWHANGEELPW